MSSSSPHRHLLYKILFNVPRLYIRFGIDVGVSFRCVASQAWRMSHYVRQFTKVNLKTFAGIYVSTCHPTIDSNSDPSRVCPNLIYIFFHNFWSA